MATTNRTQGRATTALTLPLALALPLPFPPLGDELRGFPSVCDFVQASPYRQVPFTKYEHTSVFFFSRLGAAGLSVWLNGHDAPLRHVPFR